MSRNTGQSLELTDGGAGDVIASAAIAFEYLGAARRDLRREISHQPLSEDETCSWEAIARQPTPSEAAVSFMKTVEQMLRGLDEGRF